MIFTKK